MAKIKNQLVIFLSLAVAIAGAFLFGDITGMFGLQTLTSGRLVYPNGTTATLIFDNYSTTYVDQSVANPNVFAELCSDSPNNDLLNNYLSVYIVVGNNSLNIGVVPVQMVASTISSGCSVVDADISLFTGFYPAIVSFGVANNSNMSNVSFYNLSITAGFLKGNFTIDPVNVTATNLTINVRFPVDENNNTYYIDKPLIVGVRNSTLDVVDSAVTSLDDPVTLSKPAGGYIITINNIDGPGLFVPIVDIVTPTGGQSITVGTPVLITVNATGNITQVLVNVSWDASSQLLNATFNPVTGLWEASFTSGALGLYNISVFAYDVNGGVGNGSSFFYIVAGPSGGGGSGGRSSVTSVVVPPPIVPPVVTVPPAVEEAVAAPVAPVAPVAPEAAVAPVAPEKVFEKVEPCVIVEVMSYVLLVLLISSVLFYAVYTYVLKSPVGRWLEWFVWILIAVLLALILLYNILCDEVLWLPFLGVVLVLLLSLLKFVLSRQGKKEASAVPVPEIKEEHYDVVKARNDLDKELMKLKKSIRRMKK